MRLWSIHPSYLDSKGLVACWREALLAKNVLMGKTKGYKHHPQLQRFQKAYFPVGYVSQYLVGIAQEAFLRGYNFDETKIFRPKHTYTLTVTKGQLIYEFEHLYKKLLIRDRDKAETIWEWTTDLTNNINIEKIKPHPMFTVIDGDIEEWEKVNEKISSLEF